MSDLYKFIFDTDNRLPFLSRSSGGVSFDLQTDGQVYGNLNKLNKVYDSINVIKDFPWTKSPKSSREDVPEIQLIEKRIINNSSLANFFYTLLAAADVGDLVGSRVESGDLAIGQDTFNIYDTASDLADFAEDKFFSNDDNNLKNPFNTLVKGIGKASDFAREQGGNLSTFSKKAKEIANGFVKFEGEKYVEAYAGLYFTEDTGFRYNLPYLNNDYLQASVSMGAAGGMGDKIRQVVQEVGDIFTLDKPGTYIEQSKQLNLGDDGRSLTVKFPLLNTGTYEEIKRNWQLAFALVYQNKHGRVNRALIEVPCIYEVFMEGVSYMPYAYMESINIDFLGARRKMVVDIPEILVSMKDPDEVPNTRRQIETVIPDAYMIEMTIKGLNPESRNFMMRSLGNPIVKVNEKLPAGGVDGDSTIPPANNNNNNVYNGGIV